jgi:hypothetical protein
MKIGDFVSAELWDKAAHPFDRIGTPAKVLKIDTECYSDSGTIVTVVGASGKTMRVDSNWLRPIGEHGKEK